MLGGPAGNAVGTRGAFLVAGVLCVLTAAALGVALGRRRLRVVPEGARERIDSAQAALTH